LLEDTHGYCAFFYRLQTAMPYTADMTELNPFSLMTVDAADGAQLQVSPYGGHICAWRSTAGVQRLYLSPKAQFNGKEAIRGGVPVIFPQFAADGPLPKHGFARQALWQVLPTTMRPDGQGNIALELRENEATRSVFPHTFRLTLTAVFSSKALKMHLAVQNTGAQAFAFTAALHTYLAAQRSSAAVHGLEHCPFIDSAVGGRATAPQDEPIRFTGEIDRRYHAVSGPVELRDAHGTLRMTQTGFADVVVWNPGAVLTQKIADLPADGFEHFVCVESAMVATPVQLAAGGQWSGVQRLEVLS
jgi:glucose-6-phosphate 1-epimerase